jgi:G:T-mismatch repair DNA endonuclease (very short patch repair protein)
MPTGDRAENLGRAIAVFTRALEVRTREADPLGWAQARLNLGLAYRDRAKLVGGRPDLVQAVASVRAAASVFTESGFPFGHQNWIAPNLVRLWADWLLERYGTIAEFDAIPPAE